MLSKILSENSLFFNHVKWPYEEVVSLTVGAMPTHNSKGKKWFEWDCFQSNVLNFNQICVTTLPL